uniref:Cytochrome c class I n=1 Tax=Caulobacter sp. (strain K31) TaxID=366602 RepID=B0T5J3_CAUSK
MRILTWLGATAFVFALPVSTQAAGDPARGKAAFSQCAACHAVEPSANRVGPSLAGVFGRKKGSAAKFSYSSDLAAAGGTWDDKSLDAFLTDPKAAYPKAKMFLKVANPQTRADLVAYLKTLKPAAK